MGSIGKHLNAVDSLCISTNLIKYKTMVVDPQNGGAMISMYNFFILHVTSHPLNWRSIGIHLNAVVSSRTGTNHFEYKTMEVDPQNGGAMPSVHSYSTELIQICANR